MQRCTDKKNGCEPYIKGKNCTAEEYLREEKIHLESLERAKRNELDIESDDCCLRGFGTIEERKFYRKKWEETYEGFMKSHDNSYPEWWETTGYTKEELDFSWVLQDNK